MATPALASRVQPQTASRDARLKYERGFCPKGCGAQMLIDKSKPDAPCIGCYLKQK